MYSVYLVGYVEPEVVADKRLRSIFPARFSGSLALQRIGELKCEQRALDGAYSA